MSVNNLPLQPTSFVGREKECADIASLLSDPTCRLLTLVGPGGIGKTSLSVQAASELVSQFTDGVHFISLAPVTSPDFLPSTIASVLQISFFSLEEPRVQLMNFLSRKRMLLVMDNFEHLLDGAELLTELLQAAPNLKILVTSRERLSLREEWIFPLGGLPYPTASAVDSLENYGAVQLFVQRARQVQIHFTFDQNVQAVLSICRQIEGMPLALELAASWLWTMSCPQIATHIENNIDFLISPLRNFPERHRSLLKVFDQSWNLLSDAEQTVFMKLSIFHGGFDLEAAQHIADASPQIVASLVDKSLIRLHISGRYDLHELLRQYAAERLNQAQEFDATAWRHLDYFTRFAGEAQRCLFSANQTVWFDKLETEQDNLRTALAFAVNEEAGLHLAASLGWFFGERPHWNEGLSWLERALAANTTANVSLRAKAFHNAAALVGHLGDKERLDSYCQQAIALAQTIHDDWNLAWALCHLGFFSVFHPGYDANQLASYLEKSVAIFRRLNDQMGLAHSLVRLAWNALDRQDIPYARSLIEEAGQLADKAGDTIIIAWVNKTLGNIAQDSGNLRQARIHLEKSIEHFRQAQLPEACNMITIDLADLELQTENIERAEKLYKESIKLHRTSLLNHPPIPDILAKIARIAQRQGQFERSVRLLGAAHVWGIGKTATLLPDIDAFETSIATLRSRLEQNTFNEAWATGQAMTLDQAIAYALEDKISPSKISLTSSAADYQLTEREFEVLRLVAEGCSNKDIADRLFIGVSTVKKHINHIYDKLDTKNRTQAVARAKGLNLLI